MEKTSRLYQQIGDKMKYYNFSALDTDDTWQMKVAPYPPDTSFQFLTEDQGVLTSLLEIWDAYLDGLFYYAHKADLLDSDFGRVWFDICWIGNTDDGWKLSQNDLRDFIQILETIPFYTLSPEQQDKENIFIPKVERLEQLRGHLLKYLRKAQQKGSTVYITRD